MIEEGTPRRPGEMQWCKSRYDSGTQTTATAGSEKPQMGYVQFKFDNVSTMTIDDRRRWSFNVFPRERTMWQRCVVCICETGCSEVNSLSMRTWRSSEWMFPNATCLPAEEGHWSDRSSNNQWLRTKSMVVATVGKGVDRCGTTFFKVGEYVGCALYKWS